MPREGTGVLDHFDRFYHGRISKLFASWRKQQPPLTYSQIAERLRSEHQIQVSVPTACRWWNKQSEES